MLTEYQFSNFKAFSGPATIPIKPITLIFGPNSSGKSSIFQSLLMLKQSSTYDRYDRSILKFNGPLVNLGKHSDISYGHNTINTFSFKVTLNRSAALRNMIVLFENRVVGIGSETHPRFIALSTIGNFNSIGLEITLSHDGKSSMEVKKIKLFMGNDLQPLFTYQQDELLAHHAYQGDNFYLKKINFSHDFWKDYLIDSGDIPLQINDGITSIFSILEKSNELHQKEKAIDFLSKLFGLNNDYINTVRYFPMDLNGFRLEEIRNLFLYDDDGEDGYKKSGEEAGNLSLYTIAAAFAFEEYCKRIIHIGPIRDMPSDMNYSREEIDDINRQLDIFDIGYLLKQIRFISHADDIKDMYRTLLYDKKCNIHVGLKDVGVGVSQILPVILQCVASSYETLLIEQPELHLHPALQTELGDVFINAAQRGKTLLIETHSEHLILRILRRIRETTAGELPEGMPAITPNDVAVLYVKPGKDGSEVIHIPVNEDGEFDKPWPDGFFSERARELF